MDDSKYIGKIDSILIDEKSVKNYSFRALFTSENFIPQSQYTNEAAIGYIKNGLKEGHDILLIPEYKKVTFAHMRVNREKLEKAQNFREMTEQVTIDPIGLMQELGFRERDEHSVMLDSTRRDALDKLINDYREYPDRLRFLVVVNKKIYVVTF
ncbi:MAG: hypothetical protein JXA43_03470 [Candidatus Diapherotrites archaeon]|nr:hypothetical protein [Candidatus Diapherotrites archaeon]